MASLKFSRNVCKNTMRVNGLMMSRCCLKTASGGPTKISRDWIGPPDPDSNIRPYKLYQPPDESPAERRLREFREDTLRFNQEFWSKHNKQFSKSKEKFISEKLMEHRKQHPTETVSKLNPEQLSVFYREFLDEKYTQHQKYLGDWYKMNFKLVWMAAMVRLQRIIGR